MIDLRRPLINDLRHPAYVLNQDNWEKWRLTYEGGSRFLRRYLKRHSRRESNQDFAERLAVSYTPAFAKAAINEIKNSIFQRTLDITREGGPVSYRNAVLGQQNGVDLLGSSMNTFVGRDLLPELLTMARVGVYVDMPRVASGSTLIETQNKRPYIYYYRAEDIRSWTCRRGGDDEDPTEFTALLLRDSEYNHDDKWSLPYSTSDRYRYLWVDEDDGYVHCEFYSKDEKGSYVQEWLGEDYEIRLDIRKIPFVMFELTDSLLADVSDYQIALLNLASSDLAYALKSNIPFYVEQTDMRSGLPFMKQSNQNVTASTGFDPASSQVIVNQDKNPEIYLGLNYGRRYPLGAEKPDFIAPPTAPLLASMEKQRQLKEEIRELVLLAVSNLTTQRQSAESKDADNDQLEAGLSYIGIELEHGERKIAEFWSMYEGTKDVPTVYYPDNYSLLTDSERYERAKALKELMPTVPSLTYRKEIAKQIAKISVGRKIDTDTFKKIESEIDSDPIVIADPSIIASDVTNGLVDPDTASRARGYPAGVAKLAEEAQARKLEMIAAHQSKPNLGNAARGTDPAPANRDAETEKKETQSPRPTDPIPTKRTRGDGK